MTKMEKCLDCGTGITVAQALDEGICAACSQKQASLREQKRAASAAFSVQQAVVPLTNPADLCPKCGAVKQWVETTGRRGNLVGRNFTYPCQCWRESEGTLSSWGRDSNH
jgi:ribosomal protein S27AE